MIEVHWSLWVFCELFALGVGFSLGVFFFSRRTAGRTREALALAAAIVAKAEKMNQAHVEPEEYRFENGSVFARKRQE